MRLNPGRNRFEEYPPGGLELEADVCVIGSGAGGASAACALAEAGLTVVLVEEGRNWQPGQFEPTASWAFKHLYAGRGTRATRGNCVIPLAGGRGVGGSTLINSAICFRTPEPVLADWRQNHGCEHFDAAWMETCFDRIWKTIGVTVNPPQFQRENNRIFKQGADALGLEGQWMARSAPGCTGCGTCNQGCPTGGKLTVDRSFLQLALDTGRVGVYGDCRVEGVETVGDRVVAVTGRTIEPQHYAASGTFRVKAGKFVVCGGAIGSPRFLMANGLAAGPVGQNLRIHPTAYALGRFEREIVPWHGVTQGYYVDLWDRGFLLQTFSMPPDQYYLSIPFGGDDGLTVMRELRHYASGGVVVHDQDSVGHVGPSELVYWMGDEDKRRLLAGVREVARVYFAAGATQVIAGVHGVPILHSPADIDRLVVDDVAAVELGLYASHPMGTCRMGVDPETSVVDPAGRVWGWSNLHVADASMFPTSLGVNPQVTVMAMGLTVGREMARSG